ncbi:MAG: glycoside hydrolase family 92 protein, partial [Bacteroidetes bacterium]|nr:glycoside hydrolase family 92 protein [Bacteroidota bacterium]
MNSKYLNKISFLILTLFSITFVSCQSTVEENKSKTTGLTQFVDPFIGSGGHGHVFVGANVPFGGVQVGPSNFNKGWDWSSSYHYTDSIVKGFTHLNLSGTGMTDLSDFIVMPAVGERKIWAGNQEHPNDAFASFYSKETEVAKPGYYSVVLDDYNIKAELTASARVGMHRYTFPKAKQARIIIDLSEGNSDITVDTYMKQINETTFEGYRFSKGWAADQREYFTLILSKPVTNFVLYDRNDKVEGTEAKGNYIKGFLEFETTENEVIQVKMGVSSVSSKNAFENIKAEIPHWDFDKVFADADEKWNKELAKILIETPDLSKKKIFYTAMYHTMIAPNLFSDANGQYRGTDKKVYEDPGFTNYTLFSL